MAATRVAGATITVLLACLCTLTSDSDATKSSAKSGVVSMGVKTDTGVQKYCPFFLNRAPEVQRNLKNCTWFKESSCCRQEEIDATFGRVKPLRGASEECQRYTNYLMCYICSPDQYLFYLMESLTVCEEFCDAWYGACRSAILKGSVIRDLYPTGKAFCSSRRFKIDTVKNGKCFFFNPKQDTNGARDTRDGLVYSALRMLFTILILFTVRWFQCGSLAVFTEHCF